MRQLVTGLAEVCLALLAIQQGLISIVFAAEKNPTLPENALGVPFSKQEEIYSCGPAALRGILKYFGVFDGREQDLYKIVDTSPTEGTLPENLAVGARHFGLAAVLEQPMSLDHLRSHVAAGKLVILELQAWRDDEKPNPPWRQDWDDGHYVVLIGIDADFAYFMDPSTGDAYTYLPVAELIERWHDINTVRKEPLEQRDVQLGVVISGSGRPNPPKVATRRLVRLD